MIEVCALVHAKKLRSNVIFRVFGPKWPVSDRFLGCFSLIIISVPNTTPAPTKLRAAFRGMWAYPRRLDRGDSRRSTRLFESLKTGHFRDSGLSNSAQHFIAPEFFAADGLGSRSTVIRAAHQTLATAALRTLEVL